MVTDGKSMPDHDLSTTKIMQFFIFNGSHNNVM